MKMSKKGVKEEAEKEEKQAWVWNVHIGGDTRK